MGKVGEVELLSVLGLQVRARVLLEPLSDAVKANIVKKIEHQLLGEVVVEVALLVI